MKSRGSNSANVWVMPEYNNAYGKPLYGKYRKQVAPNNKKTDSPKPASKPVKSNINWKAPSDSANELPINNCFKVFVSDIKEEAGNFQRISGLGKRAVYEKFKEGGKNSEMYFVSHFEYSNLVLERANRISDPLYKWIEEAENGIMLPHNITITLYKDGKVIYSWFVRDALPVSIEFMELDATVSSILISKIEFAHRGISMFSE